jgi:hypothetical protein
MLFSDAQTRLLVSGRQHFSRDARFQHGVSFGARGNPDPVAISHQGKPLAEQRAVQPELVGRFDRDLRRLSEQLRGKVGAALDVELQREGAIVGFSLLRENIQERLHRLREGVVTMLHRRSREENSGRREKNYHDWRSHDGFGLGKADEDH